jgi:hypothetical protein
MNGEKDEPAPDAQTAAEENPHDRELDLEGPNESAPGHEPRGHVATPAEAQEADEE